MRLARLEKFKFCVQMQKIGHTTETEHVADGEVLAHRNILAINSPYFCAMFMNDFVEMKAKEVWLQSEIVDRRSAETLVDFMYTGELSLAADNVQNLIMVADLWQMTEVKAICVDYMERLITVNNCLGVLEFAEMYRCQGLEERCLQTIKQCFPLVVQGQEFLHLTVDRLTQILSFTDLTLGYQGEDVVLKALFHWLDFNKSNEDQVSQVSHLLKKVNLAATSKDCRKRILEKHHLVSHSPELQELIQTLIEEPEQGERHAQATLYVIGGFKEFELRRSAKNPRLQSMEKLDANTNKWTACADLPMLGSGVAAFTVHGHLFCCAFELVTRPGARVTITETGIFEYSCVRNEWLDAKPNFSPEALGYLDSCLQAEGAMAVCDKTNTIYTVSNTEVTCITVNLIDNNIYCRSVRFLPRPRRLLSEQHRLHSAIVVDGRLYVLGGDRHDAGNEPVPTARVIVFDPQVNQWQTCANMLEPRARMSVVQLNGQIYASGGFNVRRLASVERYNPVTDKWTAVKPMVNFRSHHQILVLNKKIWAIGGKSYAVVNGGIRRVVNLCEVYDPATDTWTEAPEQSMIDARYGFAAVAV